MTKVTAESVKELREKTGAGMMDCKKALVESGGDPEAAVEWLRRKGLAAAAKRVTRSATEGLVGVYTRDKTGALIEVNCETDFVARNELFQKAVGTIARLALDAGGDLEKLKAASYPEAGCTVEEQITRLIATIGENINLRRSRVLEVSEGVISSYVHAAAAPGLGRLGVLVALESSGDARKLDAHGHQLAMHVAAANPQAVTARELDPAVLAHEREVLVQQARASGRPDEIIQKMVEGRLRKFYEEVVLLDQIYVIDGKTKVGEAIDGWRADVGAPVKVAGIARFALGEGLKR